MQYAHIIHREYEHEGLIDIAEISLLYWHGLTSLRAQIVGLVQTGPEIFIGIKAVKHCRFYLQSGYEKQDNHGRMRFARD